MIRRIAHEIDKVIHLNPSHGKKFRHIHLVCCRQSRVDIAISSCEFQKYPTILEFGVWHGYHRYQWDFLHHIYSGDNWCCHFGLWPFRSVAVPVCGRSGLWPFRFVAVSVWGRSVCGRSGLWPFRFVAVSVCGRFGLWPFRFVAVSVCGRFGLWPLWPVTIKSRTSISTFYDSTWM